MAETQEVAAGRQQSAEPCGQAPRLAVVLAGAAGTPQACRVEAPDRVLRIWALLSATHDELRQGTPLPRASRRMQLQLEAVTAELERSVSPALASELRRLICRDETILTGGELRIEYASLLGWSSGLVAEILSELDAAAALAGSGQARVATRAAP